MAEWKTAAHLEDHYGLHRGELRSRSVAEYDASAQETIALGVQFSFTHRATGRRRIGYYHRDTARFVACDLDGYILTHYILDEEDVYGLPFSTYWED